jgi:hypothetical protein
MLSIFVALSFLFTACPSDKTAPTIYFLADDGETIDKKGDTTVLLFTKYEDPGCYIEDNASLNENIQVSSDLEAVLPIEKKVASHMGEVKKTGEYVITYSATDEAGNVGTRQKKITCKNISDIYSGTYFTKRDEISSGLGLSVCRDTSYISTISASQTVAGRMRFSKVACHEYNGKKVSFKVDADLYSPTWSPRDISAQIGYLGGEGGDKESVRYKGLTYEKAVDTMRLEYVYLKIPTQEYTAYSEEDAAVSEYTVRIKGRMDGQTPRSKIVYNENGVMLYIILELDLTVGSSTVADYVEKYYLE